MGESRLAIGASIFDLYRAVKPRPSNLLRPTNGTVYLAKIHDEVGEVSIDFTIKNVSGLYLAMSGDGSRLVVRSATGHEVRVYDIVGGDLILSTTQIGQAKGGQVALSRDGNWMALSSETFHNSMGQVEIFHYDTLQMTWSLVGTLNGDLMSGGFGWSTAFSSDGNRLAISAPFQHGGMVRVYQRCDDEWIQLGQDIVNKDTSDTSDRFGQSIDLDKYGSALVVGAPGASEGGSSRGFVQAFDLNNRNRWVPRGDKMIGNWDLDCLGGSVHITDNGYRVAVSGSPIPRTVHIFDWEANIWTLYGSNTIGGLGLAMTPNGSRLLGSSLDYARSQTVGQVQVYAVNVDASKTVWPTQIPIPSPSPSWMPSREPRPSPQPSMMPSATPTLFTQSEVVLSACRCNVFGDCIDDKIKVHDNNLTICITLENYDLNIIRFEDLKLIQGKKTVQRIENGRMIGTFTFASLTGNVARVSTRVSVVDSIVAPMRDNKLAISGSVLVSNRDNAIQTSNFRFSVTLEPFALGDRIIVTLITILLALTFYLLQQKLANRSARNDDAAEGDEMEKGLNLQKVIDECWGTSAEPIHISHEHLSTVQVSNLPECDV